MRGKVIAFMEQNRGAMLDLLHETEAQPWN